jgi:outer membrane murein-binding lipoprotein Lpp
VKPRSLLAAGVAIAVLPLLGGCGDTADQDLCTQYADLAAAVDEWQQQDPLTAEAEDLRAASEDFQAELAQLQAAAEGRLDTAITTLQANIDAFREAAIEDDSEALEAARPLLEDVREDVVEAWAVVEALADFQCDAS